MPNIIEPSVKELLAELKKRARNNLVDSRSAYEDLVDEVINEKVEAGEIDPDEDTENLKDKLLGRWEEVEEFVRRSETTKP